jgi:hypothetical protein
MNVGFRDQIGNDRLAEIGRLAAEPVSPAANGRFQHERSFTSGPLNVVSWSEADISSRPA